jgi:type IV pilus assembly protein PilM
MFGKDGLPMLLDRLKALVEDPPPAMAFEISEAGIAAARLDAKAELRYWPLKPGTLAVSPMKENVVDPDDFGAAVRALAGPAQGRKHKDAALILPDYCTRTVVLDFDGFPSDPKEQLSLIRFRLKRSVPFDVDSAAIGYHAQPAVNKRVDVVAAVAPLEIVSRYEAPFRAAGMHPGLVTASALAALELAPEGGLTAMAKLSGHTLSVMVRSKGSLKLARCVDLASAELEEVAGVLIPTFVYAEDNLGGRPEKLYLCGFGARAEDSARWLEAELEVETDLARSPLGTPGENNAGLLGYLRSLARYN